MESPSESKMNFKINLSLRHFNPSAVEFYRYLLAEHSIEDSNIANNIGIPDCEEILQVIRTEFAELQNPDTLCAILQILDSTIRQTSTPGLTISDFMVDLLEDCASNEDDQHIAYQIIHQILISLPANYPIQPYTVECIFEKHSTKDTKLQTKLALCRVLLADKFENFFHLDVVWKEILTEKTYYLLVHYIDILIKEKHVFAHKKCWLVIENLFSSDSRDDRRLGIFLVRKYLALHSVEGEDYTSWCAYLTIFENLEEKQSHLILPSLGKLPSLKMEDRWITIILRQILKHNNCLVLRWVVHCLLDTFRTVLRKNILAEYFTATNNTWLYNESFVERFKCISFRRDYQKRFLDEFAKISWKSVPMHAWLTQMKTMQWTNASTNVILSISGRVRQLQNRQIRKACRSLFITIFRPYISNMCLEDYVIFLDAFYGSMEQLSANVLDQLVDKIQCRQRLFCSYKLFSILYHQESLQSYEQSLMDKLDELPAEHHWLRILVFFNFQTSEEKQEFCSRHYGISVPSSRHSDGSCILLEAAMNEFVSKLSWNGISTPVIRKATVDWFSGQPDCVNESNFEKLLDSGGVTTFENIINPCNLTFPLTSAMLNRFLFEFRILVKENINIERIVPRLINAANKYDPAFLCKYANEILDIDETNNMLAFNVFKSISGLCSFSSEEGRELLMRGLLFGEPLSGDSRLDSIYAAMYKLSPANMGESTHEVRQLCLQYLENINSFTIEFLKDDLIDKSEKLTLNKPRYFENSKHHRLKLRIAQALSKLNQLQPSWRDYYLTAILGENNQSNVTYIYEFIVAKTIRESDLAEQLSALENKSVSNQVALIAISYLFTVHTKSKETTFIEKLIATLLPLTMGANFKTRLSAQFAIYRLLQNNKLSSFDYLSDAILKSLKESPTALEKLERDIHYNFPSDINLQCSDVILYVTNVPEDEHQSSDLEYLEVISTLKLARQFNLAKRRECSKLKASIILKTPINEDVQRKINPEIFSLDNQSHKPSSVKSEMMVVASLIDKLPNLGGIARTCEVLGIENLVLDSIKHTQSKDFQNLSMTAEKWIHISEVKQSDLHEFLIQKKCQGFSLVGAEQTAKSINFTEFVFPKKCILLLGHEKEGIPVDLIALLDFAVEIPQFGMVRSLNVHVTGAIFMYEYCKQHLIGHEAKINKE